MLVVSLAALAAQGCSLDALARQAESMTGTRPELEGSVVLRWGDGEEIALRPDLCLSGDRGNFRGVDLVSPSYVVRVAAEPLEGLGVAVIETEGARRPIFRASSCATLRGDVQRTGWRVNDVWDVSGFIEADCRLPSGEELRGRITFEHCH